MPVKAIDKSLDGRSIVMVSAGGAVTDKAIAALEGLGASVSAAGLPSDLFVEDNVTAALDAAGNLDADGVVFVPGPFTGAVDIYVEETIGACLFSLKLAMRLREARPLDFLCLAGPAGDGDDAAMAESIRNGALRQMTKVASAEGGPMDPPLTANAVFAAAGADLAGTLTHLLGDPQGYVSGITLTLTD